MNREKSVILFNNRETEALFLCIKILKNGIITIIRLDFAEKKDYHMAVRSTMKKSLIILMVMMCALAGVFAFAIVKKTPAPTTTEEPAVIERPLTALLDGTNYLIGTTYWKDDFQVKTLSVLQGETLADAYALADPWAVLSSVKIHPDSRSLTYLSSVSPYSQPVTNTLKRLNLDTQAEQASRGTPSFEVGRTLADRHFILDRDKGELLFISLKDFSETKVSLGTPITSAFLLPDETTLLYTKEDGVEPPDTWWHRTNIYAHDLKTGETRQAETDDAEGIEYKFSPYGAGAATFPYSHDYHQQQWRRGEKFVSPDGTKVALGYYRGIVVLDLKTMQATRYLYGVNVIALGWLSDTHLLVRAENEGGSFRIVDFDITTRQESRFIPEDLYWDQYWSILPDRSAVIYSASSIIGESYDACSQFGRVSAKECSGGVDVYRVNVSDKSRTKIYSNALLWEPPTYSSDGKLAAFTGGGAQYWEEKQCWIFRTSDFLRVQTLRGECGQWVR